MARGAVAAGKGQAVKGQLHARIHVAGVGVRLRPEDREVAEIPPRRHPQHCFRLGVDVKRPLGLPKQRVAVGLLVQLARLWSPAIPTAPPQWPANWSSWPPAISATGPRTGWAMRPTSASPCEDGPLTLGVLVEPVGVPGVRPDHVGDSVDLQRFMVSWWVADPGHIVDHLAEQRLH